ncbi:MAG: hypothetical protein ACI9H8_002481 [Lysobacterales bacterium]|jgi:hypothetical protein
MMLKQDLHHKSEPVVLTLESCPETVQLMPAGAEESSGHLFFEVLGNTIIGIFLLGGLISSPAWLAGLLTAF